MAAGATARRAPRKIGTRVDQLMKERPALAALAWRMRGDMAGLHGYEHDDLVQEILLKAVQVLDRFDGQSTLRTWVTTVAKRHLLQIARSARIRPRPAYDGVVEPRQFVHCPERAEELRDGTGDLLRWLDGNPDEVRYGWEIFNLLLWNHGNYSLVALKMTLHTGMPWTVQRVRAVVRKIKDTSKGLELCEVLRITNDGHKESK